MYQPSPTRDGSSKPIELTLQQFYNLRILNLKSESTTLYVVPYSNGCVKSVENARVQIQTSQTSKQLKQIAYLDTTVNYGVHTYLEPLKVQWRNVVKQVDNNEIMLTLLERNPEDIPVFFRNKFEQKPKYFGFQKYITGNLQMSGLYLFGFEFDKFYKMFETHLQKYVLYHVYMDGRDNEEKYFLQTDRRSYLGRNYEDQDFLCRTFNQKKDLIFVKYRDVLQRYLAFIQKQNKGGIQIDQQFKNTGIRLNRNGLQNNKQNFVQKQLQKQVIRHESALKQISLEDQTVFQNLTNVISLDKRMAYSIQQIYQNLSIQSKVKYLFIILFKFRGYSFQDMVNIFQTTETRIQSVCTSLRSKLKRSSIRDIAHEIEHTELFSGFTRQDDLNTQCIQIEEGSSGSPVPYEVEDEYPSSAGSIIIDDW